jgi:arabinofuranosyltransferase
MDNRRHILLAALLIFFFALIRTAWISDDAAITLRTIDNFQHGHGPVFNIGERVQAYTHPLWFLLLSGSSLVLGNIIITSYLVPILVSLTALWLFVTRIPTTTKPGLIGVAALLLSTAYLDYSTSGLENPLSHFLILLIVIAAYTNHIKHESTLVTLFFIGSLIYLTRPDLTLLILPLISIAAYRNNCSKSRLAVCLLIGTTPAVAWTLFSIYYYGFPLPNTAYAKIGNGIPMAERVGQGFIYIIDSAIRDPVTMGSILTAIILSLRGKLMERGLALGIILYLLFIVSIGGDFMSGRFLTAPLLVSAIIIAKSNFDSASFRTTSVIIIILGAMSLQHVWTKSGNNALRDILATGIADERDFYDSKTGLAHAGRDFFRLSGTAHTSSKVQVTCGGLGFTGLRGGPGVHLIDYCGLSDPLLARLPAKHDNQWRIGHFSRQLPENYEVSVRENKNLLTDPETRHLYDSLRIITRLPLTTPGRLKEIIKLNLITGYNDFDKYRFTAIAQSTEIPAILYTPQATTEKSLFPNDHIEKGFTKSLDIVMRNSIFLQDMEFFSLADNVYLISMYFNGELIPLREIRSTSKSANGYFLYQYRTDPMPKVPTDRIRITDMSGKDNNIVGAFKINEKPEQ